MQNPSGFQMNAGNLSFGTKNAANYLNAVIFFYFSFVLIAE